MNAEKRLAEIVSALERLEIPSFVMGGHAAHDYGVERNTIDYDLHITLQDWDRLAEILSRDPFAARCGLKEEILDARNLARAHDETELSRALSCLRSRRGFQSAAASGHLAHPSLVDQAQAQARNPISLAYLIPFSSALQGGSTAQSGTIGAIFDGPLRTVSPGSARHLALVEAVRTFYKQAAIAADRADKLR